MALDQGARRHLTDAALAVAVGALVMTAAAADGGATPADYALITAGSLALAAYRHAPRRVLAVSTVTTTAYVLHAHPGTLAALPVLAAVHTAARAGHRGVAALASALFLAAFVAMDLTARAGAERSLLLMRLVPVRPGDGPRRPQLAGVSAPDGTARDGGGTHP